MPPPLTLIQAGAIDHRAGCAPPPRSARAPVEQRLDKSRKQNPRAAPPRSASPAGSTVEKRRENSRENSRASAVLPSHPTTVRRAQIATPARTATAEGSDGSDGWGGHEAVRGEEVWALLGQVPSPPLGRVPAWAVTAALVDIGQADTGGAGTRGADTGMLPPAEVECAEL
ncbi:hypothetical protein T492DRAFT_839693 [Pavlovales sp. CCMP2436]|nr:hypothetical protein T492DRAFT_839693 [Pavlovales sp. CCMP2436]